MHCCTKNMNNDQVNSEVKSQSSTSLEVIRTMDTGEGDTQHDGMNRVLRNSWNKVPSLLSKKVQKQLNGGKDKLFSKAVGKGRVSGAKKGKMPPKSHTIDKDEPETDLDLNKIHKTQINTVF